MKSGINVPLFKGFCPSIRQIQGAVEKDDFNKLVIVMRIASRIG
jgi:hypothetical protein